VTGKSGDSVTPADRRAQAPVEGDGVDIVDAGAAEIGQPPQGAVRRELGDEHVGRRLDRDVVVVRVAGGLRVRAAAGVVRLGRRVVRRRRAPGDVDVPVRVGGDVLALVVAGAAEVAREGEDGVDDERPARVVAAEGEPHVPPAEQHEARPHAPQGAASALVGAGAASQVLV
jgi:hypothetical protein